MWNDSWRTLNSVECTAKWDNNMLDVGSSTFNRRWIVHLEAFGGGLWAILSLILMKWEGGWWGSTWTREPLSAWLIRWYLSTLVYRMMVEIWFLCQPDYRVKMFGVFSCRFTSLETLSLTTLATAAIVIIVTAAAIVITSTIISLVIQH